MSKKNQMIKVDAAKFGLDEIKAREIEAAFLPMINKMTELEKELNKVMKLEISPETCERAKALRLQYVNVRAGTDKIHKAEKAYYRAGGLFIDGWKNAQIFASQGIEEKLKLIEKHYENIERERIAKLEEKRQALLAPYIDTDCIAVDLGKMDDAIWENFLAGSRTGYETRMAAEKQAETDRVAEDQKQARALAAQQKENAKLKKEAAKRDAAAEQERKKAEAEREAIEEQARADREKADRKAVRDKKAKEKLAAENKELEEKMARMVTCPKCGHEFENI